MTDSPMGGLILSPQSSTQIVPPPIIQQEFLKWLSTPEEVFIWIEHNLKGETVIGYDKTKEPVWQNVTGKRVMNDEGVAETIQELRWYVNKFTFHADYKDEEIRKIMLEISNSLAIFWVRNWRRFDMEESVFYSGIVYRGIVNMIWSAYKMSGMRQLYDKILSINQGGASQDQKPKKKLLGIFPMGGG